MKRAYKEESCTQRHENPKFEPNSMDAASSIWPFIANYFQMKKAIVLTFCLLASGMAFAQQSAAPAQKHTRSPNNGISGSVRDARNVPIVGVKAFVYSTDTSVMIVSSGYTDSMGYYETNYTFPGKYNLKLVYPTEKTVMVNGVIVKKGLTDISIRMNAPESDTTLPYTNFIPKPVEKKRVKKTP